MFHFHCCQVKGNVDYYTSYELILVKTNWFLIIVLTFKYLIVLKTIFIWVKFASEIRTPTLVLNDLIILIVL